ncbi:hypothetical protein Tco_0374635 [Tanacetum coccineum]
MVGLEFCSKHNMVAYLEKTDGNTEFHQTMDFLTRSSINYALIVSPIVSTSFVEQFWTTAKSRTVNNTSYIDATVAGKPVTISEASIRSDLLFDDADGIDSLNNQAIFDNIQLMGTAPSLDLLLHSCLIHEGSGGNHGGQSSNDASISGNEDGLTLQSVYDLCVSLCKQVTAQAKEIQVLKAQGKKLKKGVKPLITHHKAWIATQTAPTPTPIFGDDETIAQVLITMSQNNRGKREKGVLLEVKRNLNSLLMMKRWQMVQEEWEAEEEKKRLDEEEANKGGHSLMNMISFRQDLMLTKILARKAFKRKRDRCLMIVSLLLVLLNEKMIKEMNEQAADASKKRVKKDDSVKREIKEEEGTRKRNLSKRKKMKSKKRKFTSKDA